MSESEIFEMLKNHAIKLGFKSGVTVDRIKLDIAHSNVVNILSNYFQYNVSVDTLFISGLAIYKQGIWADIVTEKTSEDWIELYNQSFRGLTAFMQINDLELKQKK